MRRFKRKGREEMSGEKQIEIYKVIEGEVVFDVDAQKETIWATEEQVAKLFDVDRSVINRHFKNIYREGELEEKVTCAKNAQVRNEGGRMVRREIKQYNLDAIISVGYRVNSRKATDFRIWATKVLHRYVVDGVAVNKQRLEELDVRKLREIEGALGIVKRLVATSEFNESEAKGILEIISKYSPSFKALEAYDEGHITFYSSDKKVVKKLDEKECLKIIEELKKKVKGDSYFGKLRGKAFSAAMMAVYQTFNGQDLYKTLAEKAANLLYLIIKDHPFYDGNKRIGALLFVVFLTINDYHLTENGETKISDRALTALALLIAESDPEEKAVIVALICKLIE